jgi:hypothetical protein
VNDRAYPRDKFAPAACFAVALLTYAATLYPSFAPRDAADLALAARTLGVAHPPGYPLYALLGRLWLAVPGFGGADYRLNLLSATAGALAAGLLAAWGARRGRWAAWAGGLTLAFCAPLWKFSLLEEMYSLQAAFAAALLLLSEGRPESLVRRAAASGLLFGLGLVNHQSLVLLLPSLMWLWRAEARENGLPLTRIGGLFALSMGIGLLAYAVVPVRLEDLRRGVSIILRSEYGTLTLFSGYSVPFTIAAWPLIRHWAQGWAAAGSPLLLAAGLAGFWSLRRTRWLGAALLGSAAAGPGFFLLTRFDVSTWVARSALEPAFLLPAFWLSVGAAALVGSLEKGGGLAPAAATGLLIAAALGVNAPVQRHRDDFSAYDYARGLRQTLPPGSLSAVRGDTALFTLALTAADRRVAGPADKPGFSVGLPVARAQAFGRPAPAGLALRLDGRGLPQMWSLYALRRGGAMEREESYARDASFDYAFARHNTAVLAERKGGDGTSDALWAAAWDPEDFRVQLSR